MENRLASATARKNRVSFDQVNKFAGFDDLRRVKEDDVVAFKQTRLAAGRNLSTVANDIAACGTVCK